MRRMSQFLVLPALLMAGLATAQDGANRVYAIDAAASDLHWLVFKAGTLERLGHNHVIAVAEPHGTVTVSQDLAASRFEIDIPVAALVVDNPERRKGLGEPFASVPTADDVAGTRKNMLGDRVLQGEKFSTIRVTGTGPIGAGEAQQLKVTVELLGRSVPLTLPTHVTVTDDVVEAGGEFELSHTDLGMKPFSVMLGALQVADKMKFSYHVRAQRTAAVEHAGH